MFDFLTTADPVLFTLAKHARQTGVFRLARHALEKMQVELHTAVDVLKIFGDACMHNVMVLCLPILSPLEC